MTQPTMRPLKHTAFSVAGLLLCLPAAWAQVPPGLPPSLDPGAAQQQSIDTQRRLIEELRERRGSVAEPVNRGSLGQPAPAPGGDRAARVRVKTIEFTASEVLKPDELRAIAAEYEGREVGFGDLQALVARVNALYRSKGAIASEAVLPAQDVSSGVVRVRLVEGRVGQYNLSGNASTRESYVTDRLGTPPGALFDIATLEGDLIWFNRSNEAQLRATLKPGTAFGTTDVDLELQEPPRNALRVYADNAGIPATGQRRVGAIYQNRSLLGWRDDLVLSTNRSDGAQGWGATYGVPINRRGGRVSLGYNDDHTRVKYGPFAPLNINGSARSWTLAVRQPVIATLDTAVSLSLALSDRLGRTFIDTVPLQQIATTDTSVGVDILHGDATGSWTGNATLIAGRAKSPAVVEYTVLRAALSRDQRLGDRLSLRGALSMQTTGDSQLPSGSQFFIGGASTVRGYQASAYSGTRGHVLNLELRRAFDLPATGPLGPSTVVGFVFTDAGQARPVGPGQPTVNLASAGLGVDALLAGRVTLRATWASQINRPTPDQSHQRLDLSVIIDLL